MPRSHRQIQRDRDQQEISRRWAWSRNAAPAGSAPKTEADMQQAFVASLKDNHAELCRQDGEFIRRAWQTGPDLDRIKQRIADRAAARQAEIAGAEQQLEELRRLGR